MATFRTPAPPPRSVSGGHSLVELLTVAALVALIAGFAYPLYRDHVRRAHRAQARATLMEASQFMQEFHAVNDRYDARPGEGGLGDEVLLPVQLQSTPGARPAYTLTLLAVTADSFTLAASPVGVMSNDSCGTLTLTHAGVQGATGAADARALDSCWR